MEGQVMMGELYDLKVSGIGTIKILLKNGNIQLLEKN